MSLRSRFAFPAFFLAAIAGAAANADIINVPGDLPLSVAIAVATSGDEIVISPSGSPYLIAPGLIINNKAITLRGSTGNPEDVVIDAVNLDIVLQITGAGASGTTIEGLTIRNGRGTTSAGSSGAGIRIASAGNITIRDCIIRDNVLPASDGNGAGLYSASSNLTIERTHFINNTLTSNLGDGGGIFITQGTHRIIDSTFTGNGIPLATTLVDGGLGGGISADNAAITITRCTFTGNRNGLGGAIWVSGNNAATTIDESIFRANNARYGGGFYASPVAGANAPRIRNTLFDANTVAVNDAAIYTSKPTTLTNLTIVNNVAAGSYIVGGAAAAGAVIVDNCILWGNTYNTANGLFAATTPEVVRRCILQQAFTGAPGSGFNQVINPEFVDAANGDYRLSETSPAIDAGDTNLYFGPFADLDGLPRVVDNPDVLNTGFSLSGPVIDIGAYEFQVATFTPNPCPADFNGDTILDFFDVQAFLAQFSAGCP